MWSERKQKSSQESTPPAPKENHDKIQTKQKEEDEEEEPKGNADDAMRLPQTEGLVNEAAADNRTWWHTEVDTCIERRRKMSGASPCLSPTVSDAREGGVWGGWGGAAGTDACLNNESVGREDTAGGQAMLVAGVN